MASEETVSEVALPESLRMLLEDCWALVDDTIDKEQNIVATNQRNDELESKYAAELMLNKELKEKLQQKIKSSSELEKMCSQFETVNIKESDQTRLNNAQELVKIGKEYTMIRWDYTAPPNIAKGYVKNSDKKIIEVFEYEMDEADNSATVANLWKYVGIAANTNWQDLVTGRVLDKENVRTN